MDKKILDEITDSMNCTDDLAETGISFDTLDPETQREVLITLYKNQIGNLDKLKKDYEEMKKKCPDLHIDFLEA
jgi:hypothetical protein